MKQANMLELPEIMKSIKNLLLDAGFQVDDVVLFRDINSITVSDSGDDSTMSEAYVLTLTDHVLEIKPYIRSYGLVAVKLDLQDPKSDISKLPEQLRNGLAALRLKQIY